jgi:hypothetical protein
MSSLHLQLFSRMATLRDDGTVHVNIPTNLEATSPDLPPEAPNNVVMGREPLESSGLQHRPPMQIVMLIVARGDVQPFIAIGKRLQVGMLLIFYMLLCNSLINILDSCIFEKKLIF